MERLNRPRSHSLRRFAWWLVLANLLVDAAIFGSLWQIVTLSRSADQRLSESSAQNIAQTLSHDLASDLAVVDRALSSLVVAAGRPSSEGAVRAKASLLAPILGTELGKLCLLGSDGVARNVSGEFAAAELGPKLGRRMLEADGVQISGPVAVAAGSSWVVLVSRRILDTQGNPSGAVFAQIPVEYFLSSARKLDLGTDGAVSVRTDDLRLVARYSPRDT